jgi:hypothetical protein
MGVSETVREDLAMPAAMGVTGMIGIGSVIETGMEASGRTGIGLEIEVEMAV